MLKRKHLDLNNNDEDKNENKKMKNDPSEEANEPPEEIILIESDNDDDEEDEDDDEYSDDFYFIKKNNNFSSNFIQKVSQLSECLHKVKGYGNYSLEGQANELPSLIGLEIKDFGPVLLPFMDPQASKLIEICQQAPFGRNKQALFYQLDSSAINITNPAWNVKLKELISRVAKGLGCLSEIEARLKKLLVYKKGDHFLKHRNTENKEEEIFGTLEIQLPSRYEGGELVLYESGGGNRSKRVIDFGQKEGQNEFEYHFAAHYDDLEHELLEVKSGYRLVLVYSLCWLSGKFKCLFHLLARPQRF
jgi:hypothetical protein